MKYFIVSDIHSYYREFYAALKNEGFDEFDPNHMLIVCGDIFDRGSEPFETFLFLNYLKDLKKVILIRGNHEALLSNLLERDDPVSIDIVNGTLQTVFDLGIKMGALAPGATFHECRQVLLRSNFNKFLDDMIDSIEIGNYVFTHGYLPYDEATNKIYDDYYNYDFSRAHWFHGYDLAKKGIILKDKIIVCGHVGAYRYRLEEMKRKGIKLDVSLVNANLFAPLDTKGCITIDATTMKSGFVNVLVLEI